jgi:hypothetical protein
MKLYVKGGCFVIERNGELYDVEGEKFGIKVDGLVEWNDQFSDWDLCGTCVHHKLRFVKELAKSKFYEEILK